MGETISAEHKLDCYPGEEGISWGVGVRHFNQAKSSAMDSYLLSDADFKACRTGIRRAQHETTLEIKQAQLASFQPALLPVMDEATLIYWERLFKQAFLLALFQYNLNCSLVRKQRKASDLALLKSYERALAKINDALNRKQAPIVIQGSIDEADITHDLKQDNPSRVPCCLQGPYTPCVAIRETLSEMNWYRLYWVWAGGNGGLLAAVLSLPGVKSHYDKEGKMAQKLDMPLNILGYLSWTLYYLRFILNLLMMLKHLLPVGENKKFSLKERFAIQWAQRKFTMMNDLVWGTVDLVTVYWLTGNVSKMAGAWGGVLTVCLMLFDVFLAYKERREEKARFDTANHALKQKISQRSGEIEKQIEGLHLQNMLQVDRIMAYHYKVMRAEPIDESDEDAARLAETVTLKACHNLIGLDKEKSALEEEKALLIFDWYFREKVLTSTLYFNIAFVPVMALIVGNVLPDLIHGVTLSMAALSAVTVVGGGLAVLITVAQTYYQKQQAINKLQAELDLVIEKKQSTHEPLALSRLIEKAHYLEKMIDYERRSQIFSISAQLIFAGAVFGALACSTPVGLGIIAGVILLGLVMKLALRKSKPSAPNLLDAPVTPTLSDHEKERRTDSKPLLKCQSAFFSDKTAPLIAEENKTHLLRVA